MRLNEWFKVYRWALGFLWAYRTRLILFIAASLFVALVQMAIPLTFQRLLDQYLPEKDFRGFFLFLAGLTCLLILMLLVMVWQNVMQRKLQEYTARDVQLVLFEHLRRLGFPYYERHPVGETLTLFQTEVVAMQQLYKQYFPDLIKSMIMLAVSIILMVSISWKLCLYTIPAFLIYYVIGPYAARKSAQYGKEGTELRSLFIKKVFDTVSSLLELRAFSAQKWDSDRFMTAQQSMYRILLKHLSFNYIRGSARGFSVNVGTVFLFLFGSKLLISGEILIGTFIAFTFYYFMVMNTLAEVITLLIQQRMVMFHTEKVYQFMQEIPEVKEPDAPVSLNHVSGEIHFDHVYFSYGKNKALLSDFDLHVKPGEHVAIIGHSGCGKSTLLKLIARFYDTDRGEIRLEGIPVQHLSFQDLRSKLGIVFQETFLFGSSIKDNIRFANWNASDEEIKTAAQSAFAHDFIIQLPQGYDTLVGERGVKLSGGQRQRIAIARMFLKNPSVILLDEATSALDNHSENEVKYAFDHLLKSRTTITVAHRLSTIFNYDRLIFINNGMIAEQGTYEELMHKRGMFRTFVEGEVRSHA